MAAPYASLLGPPLLWVDGNAMPWLPERRYQLLAWLAVHGGQWLPRDRAAALLWPDHDPGEARRNLRKVVLRAREVPGAQALEVTDHALRWPVDSDLQAFKAALASGRAADAVALARGPLLAGLDAADADQFNDWLAAERRHWAEGWRAAALAAVAAAAQPAERIDLAQRMLAADPLDEAAIEVALRAELALGHRPRAQRLYNDYAERLAEAYGVEPAAALRDLVSPGSASAPAALPTQADPQARRSATQSPDAADTASDTFIGRKLELNELALLLSRADARLVTVLGPGGCGKSRLAREAMRRLAPGSATWVELHDLQDLQEVVARIAQRLDVQVRAGSDAVAAIARHADAGERHLLVLDNGEHLDGLPGLLQRLCDESRSLQLLLTSRVRCHTPHEWVLPLQGLAVPDEASRDLDAAAAFDAIRLFERRAAAAQRGFDLAQHLDAAIDIVDTVGGLPLAIELAAGWVRLLPPQEIARELRQSIDVLERDPAAPSAPARPEHHSMRAVLDRSWQLLAPREREALAALSVFHGGFTRRAAAEVASVPLPLLSSLVDKSLLNVDENGRFGMHPLVVALALGHAEAAGRDARALRHAEHYAEQLAELAQLHPNDQRPIVAAIQADMANGQRAWSHAVAQQRSELVLKALPAWRRHFMASGRFEEGASHFHGALALAERPGAARALAEVRATLAWLAISRHDPEQADALAREAIATAERLGDTRLIADCCLTLGVAHAEQFRHAEAKPWFERALHEATAHGHRFETARALNSLGALAARAGDHTESLRQLERAQAAFRDLGDHTNVARILQNMGSAHMQRVDWPAARHSLEQALRYARAHDVQALLPPIEFLLGATLIELDELEAADHHLASARERCRAMKYASYEIKTDYYLARIAARRGRHDEAGRAHLVAARQALDQGWTIDLIFIALFVGELLRDSGHPDAARIVWRALTEGNDTDRSARAIAAAHLQALRPGAAAATPPGIGLDALTHHLANSADIGDLLLRLRAAGTAAATGKR